MSSALVQIAIEGYRIVAYEGMWLQMAYYDRTSAMAVLLRLRKMTDLCTNVRNAEHTRHIAAHQE